jgi:N-acyl-phosphatidylethanolamine-hydrolysing phospholipase D
MTQKNKPAHHASGGGFRNPWPGGAQAGTLALFKWMWQRWNGRSELPRQPGASTFPRVAPSFAMPRLDAGSLSATWVGHSTLLLQVGALNVLVDPVWSDRASPFPFAGPKRWVPPGVALDALPPLDVVLLSHNHYDHFDVPTIRRLAALHPAARWHVPLGLAGTVTTLGARHVVEQDWWDERAVTSDDSSAHEAPVDDPSPHEAAWIGCTPAQHFSARGPHDRDRTLWCGWTVRTAQWRVYFAGDSGWFPEFGAIARRFGPFDLAAIPIGAYQPRWFMQPVHMDPDEALRAWEAIVAEQPGHECPLLPIHWGTFKLTDEAMDEPPRRLREKWEWEGRNSGLLWLLRHGETRMKTR